jgi:RNA polymerase sigma-70 factor (ECF subfamily)
MDGLSDEALLAGLTSGDADNAAAFVRRFQSRVYGLALTMVGDPELAEEVAQETFVRAWRHGASYDVRRGRVSSWLLTIARNLAIDRSRLRPATPTDPDVIASQLELARHDALPDIAERDRLRRAAAALPAEQRRALVLAVFGGRTAREIAELDDLPLGTVKSRIRAAMATLRGRLEVPDGL